MLDSHSSDKLLYNWVVFPNSTVIWSKSGLWFSIYSSCLLTQWMCLNPAKRVEFLLPITLLSCIDCELSRKDHPEDILPLVLTSVTQDLFGCIADEDVTVANPYKLLKKDDIIQDLKSRAAVSDFSPMKQIVLVRWIICYTDDSVNIQQMQWWYTDLNTGQGLWELTRNFLKLTVSLSQIKCQHHNVTCEPCIHATHLLLAFPYWDTAMAQMCMHFPVFLKSTTWVLWSVPSSLLIS